MLVTDGVPYTYETIFQEYNQPHKPVRVFTYLIGREISDLQAAKWMACENKGYFTHVTTLAEVKEQVLKYIPVMARPLVLLRDQHPVRWTGVYADIEVRNNAVSAGYYCQGRDFSISEYVGVDKKSKELFDFKFVYKEIN